MIKRLLTWILLALPFAPRPDCGYASWIGRGNREYFNDPANWEGRRLPQDGDTIIIWPVEDTADSGNWPGPATHLLPWSR